MLALDVEDIDTQISLLDAMPKGVRWIKLGYQSLMTSPGYACACYAASLDYKLCADLKFHDTPAQVVTNLKIIHEYGFQMVTLHTAERAAVRAAGDYAMDQMELQVIGVTVLTSQPTDIPTVVERAAQAYTDGLDGVVASAREARAIRHQAGHNIRIVTPGIRPAGTETHDHARYATPTEAVQAGTNYIVVGRPILDAPCPKTAATAILTEIEAAYATHN